jgi:hypothetical protein
VGKPDRVAMTKKVQRLTEVLIGACLIIALGRAAFTAFTRFFGNILIGFDWSFGGLLFHTFKPLALVGAVGALMVFSWFYLERRFLALVLSIPIVVFSLSPPRLFHALLGDWIGI